MTLSQHSSHPLSNKQTATPILKPASSRLTMGSAGPGEDDMKELVIFDDAEDGGASGQTCRLALIFSALTLTPIKVMNVMSGDKDPKRKSQGK